MFKITVKRIEPTSDRPPLFALAKEKWPPEAWEYYMIFATVRAGGLTYPVGLLVHNVKDRRNILLSPYREEEDLVGYPLKEGDVEEVLAFIQENLPRAWRPNLRRFDPESLRHTNSK